METENIKNEIEIDIRGLLAAILNRLTIIILVGILVGGIAFAYTQYFVEPQYVSKTQVYISCKQDEDQNTFSTSDLALATYLANDYKEFIVSKPVLEEVKKDLDLDQSVSTLKGMISVELIEDTRIMEISVVSTDPKLAKKIADAVRDTTNEKTVDWVPEGIEPVHAMDEANLPISPSSPNVEKNTMIGFIIGFGISVLVVMVMFILDDTIKTPDDIEKRLGVSVLASIPLKSATTNSKAKTKDKQKNSKEKNIDDTHDDIA